MKTILTKSFVLAILAGATVSSAAPREQADAKPSTSTVKHAKQQKPPKIDPQAIGALNRVGTFLRGQRSFAVETKSTTDYVLPSGQKIQRASRGDLAVQRPDRLHASVVGDNKNRQFFYDGATFTIFSPDLGYYAQVAAPATLLGLADMLHDEYALQLPLVDLFRWGTDPKAFSEITAAMYVGESKIDGVPVDQYAFRQPGVDWQVWIQRGPNPIPRKILLTTTDDKARPEHAIEMSWQLGVQQDERQFVFVPPKGAQQISMNTTENIRAQQRATERARRSTRAEKESL